jgi:hypothetical protein
MSESPNTPTVILVHGGFADASFWVPVKSPKCSFNPDRSVATPDKPLRSVCPTVDSIDERQRLRRKQCPSGLHEHW